MNKIWLHNLLSLSLPSKMMCAGICCLLFFFDHRQNCAVTLKCHYEIRNYSKFIRISTLSRFKLLEFFSQKTTNFIMIFYQSNSTRSVSSIQRQHQMRRRQQLLIQLQRSKHEWKPSKFIDGIRISQMKSHTCKNMRSIWMIVHRWCWMLYSKLKMKWIRR